MPLPDPDRSRVVLVGTSTYLDAGDDLGDLPAVENNLQAIRDVLTDPALGGLRRENCLVVPNPAREGIVLDALNEAVTQASHSLIVYYAGHGLVDELGNLHLGLTRSRSQPIVAETLPFEKVRQMLQRTPVARVVILDCCYSGIVVGSQGANNIADKTSVDGSYVLTSSAATEASLAPPDDRFTVFTGHLIRLLQDGVPGGPPELGMPLIYTHLYSSLAAAGKPRPQRRIVNAPQDLALARNVAWRPPTGMPTDQRNTKGTSEKDAEPEGWLAAERHGGTRDKHLHGDASTAPVAERAVDGAGDPDLGPSWAPFFVEATHARDEARREPDAQDPDGSHTVDLPIRIPERSDEDMFRPRFLHRPSDGDEKSVGDDWAARVTRSAQRPDSYWGCFGTLAGLATVAAIVVSIVLILDEAFGSRGVDRTMLIQGLGVVLFGLATGALAGGAAGMWWEHITTGGHWTAVARDSAIPTLYNGLYVGVVWVAAVPLLKVGWVLAWAVAVAPLMVVPYLCRNETARAKAPLLLVVGFLAVPLVIVGNAQAVVGETSGVFGLPGRLVDDGTFYQSDNTDRWDITSGPEDAGTTSSTTTGRPPGQITVRVLDASGGGGEVDEWTLAVAERGYQTVEPGDAPPPEGAGSLTLVLFADGYDREARALMDSIGMQGYELASLEVVQTELAAAQSPGLDPSGAQLVLWLRPDRAQRPPG